MPVSKSVNNSLPAAAEREYPVGISWLKLLLAIMFFGACTAFYVYRAVTDDRGLILNHLIEFSPQGARQFWWILGGLSFALVALGLIGCVNNLRGKQRIVLGREAISVPRGRWSRENVLVPYPQIQAVTFTVTRVQRRDFRSLAIRHPGGSYTISDRTLPKPGDLDDIRAVLAERAPHAGR